ncbi:MAG: Holliday junction branch migration protein RuvA [Tidjanibacter sp.]|nr:Holliday junction branch migration protein RuvA [Tidjanibacter sp.]MBR7102582.1 Holliday junction branch migration protein RuvA [Tidjanibacter sp.]
MYEFIEGIIEELAPTQVVIGTASGVGYLMNISLQTYTAIEKASRTRLYTHFIVKEDSQTLFGFADKSEREVFRRLISVSGVGGNTARTILSTYSPQELSNIISTENATLLKNVKGLGLKTAQKIIVELKDKMFGVGVEEIATAIPGRTTHSKIFEEATAALTMLGYTKAQAEKAVTASLKDNPAATVEEAVRMSLKTMK